MLHNDAIPPHELPPTGAVMDDHRLTVWIPGHLYDYLRDRAEQEGSPLATVIRHLLYLDWKAQA